jgi:hypothetical protein
MNKAQKLSSLIEYNIGDKINVDWDGLTVAEIIDIEPGVGIHLKRQIKGRRADYLIVTVKELEDMKR